MEVWYRIHISKIHVEYSYVIFEATLEYLGPRGGADR